MAITERIKMYGGYLPDPIERGEDRCENWYFENVQPDGRVRCQCGKLFRLEDAVQISPDPYSIPVCPDCGGDEQSKIL